MEFGEQRLLKLCSTLLLDWHSYMVENEFIDEDVTVADVQFFCKDWIKQNVDFVPEEKFKEMSDEE